MSDPIDLDAIRARHADATRELRSGVNTVDEFRDRGYAQLVLLVRYVPALLAEVERLRKEVGDLRQHKSNVACAFCGQFIVHLAPTRKERWEGVQAIQQHTMQCPQHPLHSVRKENEHLWAEVKRLREQVSVRPSAATFGPWTTLEDLPKGALFQTRDGILAVKSEYHYGNEPGSQWECILLASGEFAHFPKKNAEEVREVILDIPKVEERIDV